MGPNNNPTMSCHWNFIPFGKYPTFEIINLLVHSGMWRHLERKKEGGGDLGVNGGIQARCCWRTFWERKLWVKSFKLALRRVLSYAWTPLGFRVYIVTYEMPKESKHMNFWYQFWTTKSCIKLVAIGKGMFVCVSHLSYLTFSCLLPFFFISSF